MEPCNQSFGESFPSNNTCTKEIPLFLTYFYMVVVALMATIVIIPSAMVINVIWWIKELHKKYYFFVACLLATNIVSVIIRSVGQYVIMILYLFGMNSDSASVVLQVLVFPLFVLSRFVTITMPITIAIERMIVIGFPYRHRSIMTTKTVIGILTMLWGVSLVLSVIISIVMPVDVVWPFALVYLNAYLAVLFVFLRLTSSVLITIANVFLYYQVWVSNRKAKENERLGNEEETKKFEKLIQLLRMQIKPTITLLLVGGIDVIGNVLIATIFTMIFTFSTEPYTSYYLAFLMHPLISSLSLCHPLVYGFYMKKIRNRLPKCPCPRLWNTQRSKVVRLHQRY